MSDTKTLDEKVRAIVEPLDSLTITHVCDEEVSVSGQNYQYWITATHVIYADMERTIGQYANDRGRYRDTFSQISRLLVPIKDNVLAMQAKYLETKQHYADLKTNYQRLNEDYTRTKERVAELEKYASEVECENGSLGRDIEHLNQQLKETVSKFDHEAEMEKWKPAFSEVSDKCEEYIKQLEVMTSERDAYRRYFITEYAKNEEVEPCCKHS